MYPFCTITWETKYGTKVKLKTSIKDDAGKNPEWNEEFSIEVSDEDESKLWMNDHIIVRVWDEDTFGNDAVGFAIIKLSQLCFNGGVTRNFPIYWEGSKAGTVRLSTTFTDPVREETLASYKTLVAELDHCEAVVRDATNQKANNEGESVALVLQEFNDDGEATNYVTCLASGNAMAADEGAHNLIDNSADSKWCTQYDGDTVHVDFCFNRPITLSGYSITSANDRPHRNPGKWVMKAFDTSKEFSEVVL